MPVCQCASVCTYIRVWQNTARSQSSLTVLTPRHSANTGHPLGASVCMHQLLLPPRMSGKVDKWARGGIRARSDMGQIQVAQFR